MEAVVSRHSLPATCFPPAVTLGSSLDPELAHRVGAAVAREASALGVSVVLGPGINIKRSPLCGRNFEHFSTQDLRHPQRGPPVLVPDTRLVCRPTDNPTCINSPGHDSRLLTRRSQQPNEPIRSAVVRNPACGSAPRCSSARTRHTARQAATTSPRWHGDGRGAGAGVTADEP
ncbi:glycoside hydrolase family 3 N-terminal domain-containing protein [Streptomyces sp. NBC_00250]|uniref:glycoside hydrolase family 3 N-terminal domain-containing protein n=1 Tax=Streptomyces sp. NBC_00250 TaxID=2903641 RepID=UPI002E2D7C39|nr:glycoside hydrolase family 3 N-terminal domain-containing protein [Streptomyces sp. NBC_00250]